MAQEGARWIGGRWLEVGIEGAGWMDWDGSGEWREKKEGAHIEDVGP
jgi:hypothetical protein